jgi:hypothetical protein
MLKAKFSLSTTDLQGHISNLHRGGHTNPFIVEPVTYNEKQSNVVSDDLSIMALIGVLAAENAPTLLDVSRL